MLSAAEANTSGHVKVRCWASSFDDPNSSLGRVVAQHEPNTAVEVLLGACAAVPFTSQLLAQASFWRGVVSPAALLDKSVFEGFCVTATANAEAEDAVQRQSGGVVTVQATAETHRRLGLDARRLPHSDMWRCDVSEPAPRTLRALHRLPLFRFDAVHSDASRQLPLPWARVPLEFSSARLQQTQVPAFSFRPEARRGQMETALEWIGAALAGAAFVHPDAAAGEVGIVRWRGLVSSPSVLRVIEGLRQQCRDKQVPWAAVVVRGADDDIVESGENNYAVFIHPGGSNYWAFVMAKRHPL